VNILVDQVRHNAWANYTVLAAFEQRPAVLDELAYDGDPLLERAHHVVAVERGFLDLLRQNMVKPEPPRDLAGLLRYSDETGNAFVPAVQALDDAALAREVYVPWWERSFPALVLVAQVLSHSSQHRSELAWELARAGVSTGELDYIVWTAGGCPQPGEPLAFPDEDA
jgi:uncharacterized damage-inducible protein DinB